MPKQKVGRSDFRYGVNTVRSRSNLEDGRAKRHDLTGHGLATTSQNWPPVQCCAGWSARGLPGQGELGVAASSRVPETVELATSEQRTRPPAALGLVRLPVSVRAARQMSPPRANVA